MNNSETPKMNEGAHQMSWAELKDFINSISLQVKETTQQMKESGKRMEESRKEFDKRMEESRREFDKRMEESRKETDRLVKETTQQMKESGKRMEESRKEFDKRMEESRRETERLVKETTQQMKETDRRMEESRKETDKQIEASRKSHEEFKAFVMQNIKESEQRRKQLDNLFSTQWGKLIESLSRPAALKLFRDSDIHIDHIYEGLHKADYDEHTIEVDVILCNEKDVVVVEVKTTCTNEHVKHFIKQMAHFKEAFKEFREKRVYMAVAAIKYNEHSDRYALKHGLFVLKTSGDGLFTLDKPEVPITQ